MSGEHQDFVTLGQMTVDDANVSDHTTVRVIDAVKNQRTRRRIGVTLRSRHGVYHQIQKFSDTFSGLTRDPEDIFWFATHQAG